jgi:peptide/nickel transport system ATP-binding protein
MLLAVNNLTISFPSQNQPVVKNLSFKIDEGECLGIVGESGSGKSLTAMSLAGLLPKNAITSGEINLCNGETTKNLICFSELEIRLLRGKEIAYIFQEPMTALNPSMKCGKQIMEMLQQHTNLSKDEIQKKSLDLLAEVQIPDPLKVFSSYPHQLSGGQRQRVMIAMAISCSPALLIADEPTTALDVTVQKTVVELINNLRKDRNMAVLFITHDLGVISKVADRVMVMRKGEKVEDGDTAEILSNPKKEYTKGLMACRPSLAVNRKFLPVLNDSGNLVLQEECESITKIVDGSLLLSITDLSIRYKLQKKRLFDRDKYFKALSNINLSLFKGETLGLVGESGSGKTTIGRAIALLIEERSGNIAYNGVEINTLSGSDYKQFRRRVQLIFQDPYSSLNPKHTVENILSEPMIIHKLASGSQLKSRVLELLREVNLPEGSERKYPHEFSGGQRQRICIARALAVDPELIICDESVSALDVSVQAGILNLLNRLKAEKGLTYLFISHDLSVVKHMSDRVVVLKDGVIQEMGPSEEVYKNPTSEYTKQLIASIPGIK